MRVQKWRLRLRSSSGKRKFRRRDFFAEVGGKWEEEDAENFPGVSEQDWSPNAPPLPSLLLVFSKKNQRTPRNKNASEHIYHISKEMPWETVVAILPFWSPIHSSFTGNLERQYRSFFSDQDPAVPGRPRPEHQRVEGRAVKQGGRRVPGNVFEKNIINHFLCQIDLLWLNRETSASPCDTSPPLASSRWESWSAGKYIFLLCAKSTRVKLKNVLFFAGSWRRWTSRGRRVRSSLKITFPFFKKNFLQNIAHDKFPTFLEQKKYFESHLAPFFRPRKFWGKDRCWH